MPHFNRCGLSLLHRGRWAGLLLAFVALLSACGGGGGGGGEGGGSSSDPYSISTSTVAFTAIQSGASPAPQKVMVTVNSGTVFVTTSQLGVGFGHQLNITSPTTAEITITPDAPFFGSGTFTGSISVRGCSTVSCSGTDVAGSPKTINVVYAITVPPTISSTPPGIDFLTSEAAGPPVPQSLTLTTGTGSNTWTSSIVYTANPSGVSGWLDMSSTSGTFPATIALSVTSVPAPPGTYFAAITVNDGIATTTIPVTIVVQASTVNFVSPYLGTAGVGGDVIIRGSGLTGFTQVMFGTTPAIAPTLVSDTEIRATYPGLAAGSYPVSVTNPALTLPTSAQLVIVDAPIYAYAAIPLSGTALVDLVYDAERRAVFLTRSNSPFNFQRFQFNGTTWVLNSQTSGGNSHIALSTNGAEILVTGGSQIARINPVTLAVTFVDASSMIGASGSTLGEIAFSNDGTVIGNLQSTAPGNISLYRSDLQPNPLVFRSLSRDPSMGNRIFVESGDGSRLLLPSSDPSSLVPVSIYNAGDGTLATSSVVTTGPTQASLSRTGSIVILTSFALSPSQVSTVYDSSLNPLGTLPVDLTGVVVSPDGSTAYAYFNGSRTIQKFDLNSPSGTGFTEIGTATAIADSPGTDFARMVISPDGGTLFIAGNERLIVTSAP